MKYGWKYCISTLLLTVTMATAAFPFMGEVDHSDKYEWAVMVKTVFSRTDLRCTGVAVSPTRILTAAHCLVRDGVLARDVAVMIADPKGKIVGRHKATGFLVHREHQRTEKQLLDLRRRKAAMTPAERTKPWSTDETLVLVKAASADIGMIVLKEPLAIKKPLRLMSQDKLFAKYLENAFVQEGNMPLPLALALGRTVQTFIDQFPGATFVGVGLGAHKCPHTVIVDSWAEKGCAVDNLRRYAALSVKAPFAFPIGETKGTLLIVARSPKYDALAPNLYGDSGAGLFIQPVGNDPILVGILNQGGKSAIGSPIIDTSGFIAHELGSGLVKRSNR